MKDKGKIKIVGFPVAGFGTRFLSATEAMPKEDIKWNWIKYIQYFWQVDLEHVFGLYPANRILSSFQT